MLPWFCDSLDISFILHPSKLIVVRISLEVLSQIMQPNNSSLIFVVIFTQTVHMQIDINLDEMQCKCGFAYLFHHLAQHDYTNITSLLL